MKVNVLILTTLCLAVVTQAKWDYELQCTRQEIGIRWPSYYSNSEYYICQREGGKQLKNTCPEGKLFTFALQSCTTPNKFIPPPPMNILPTASPAVEKPSSSINLNQNWFPKPIETQYPEDSKYPTVNGNEYPPSVEGSVPHPPILIDEPTYDSEQYEDEPLTPPTAVVKPQVSAPTEQPEVSSEVPQPPTPGPTPPIVQPAKKKTPPAPPGASHKQPAGKKQPPKPVSKKDQGEGEVKKTPPKPISKSQNEKVEPPKPVSNTHQ